MNKTEAKDRAGKLYAKLHWHERGSFPLKEIRYVIMVIAEENEPLFWNNDDYWVGGIENAQVYDDIGIWVPFYHKDHPASYVLYEEGEMKEIEWRLGQDEYPPELNDRGNEIERLKYGIPPYDETFMIWSHCLPGNHLDWEDLPNGQDAHYYQNWINCKTLQKACYAEGDLTIVTCKTVGKFMEEIVSYQLWAMDTGWAIWPIPFHEIRQKAEKYARQRVRVSSDSAPVEEGLQEPI